MKLRKLISNSAVVVISALPLHLANASFYPNYGYLCYDGGSYGYAYKYWSGTPGPWTGDGPGYEHDLVLNNTSYFSGCTAWTNLPSGYDDCPTVGVLENPGERVFSWGSFHSPEIVGNTYYSGYWLFQGATGGNSPFTLRAQEVDHDYCSIDNIWCMGSTGRSQNLLTGWYLIYGGYPSCAQHYTP